MNIETYYRILKHDSEGKLVKDTGLIPSHSYVIQLLEYMWSAFEGQDKNATDVNNAESVLVDTSDFQIRYGNCAGGIGEAKYGIVVGTNAGSTPEDNENYKLDTKILHSAVGEAGKLNYQAVTFVRARVVGANVDVDINRAFLNETGSTITVKEIGIICANTTDNKYFLFLRDVVADEAVLDGQTLTVIYKLRTTV